MLLRSIAPPLYYETAKQNKKKANTANSWTLKPLERTKHLK
ncbi:MAG: hypothetical protein EZS28_049190, partial [Streblomastix strix]